MIKYMYLGISIQAFMVALMLHVSPDAVNIGQQLVVGFIMLTCSIALALFKE